MPTSSAPHLRKHRFHPDSKTCKKTSQPGGKGAGSKSRPQLEIATHEPAYIWLLPSSLLTADDIRFQPRHKTSRRDPHRPRPGRAGLSEITLSPRGLGRKKKTFLGSLAEAFSSPLDIPSVSNAAELFHVTSPELPRAFLHFPRCDTSSLGARRAPPCVHLRGEKR